MYPFRQSIGIYYEDEEWALEIFNTIIKEKEVVEKSIRSKNSWYIVFKDGSLVRFLKYNIMARGFRHTKAYLQNKNLDQYIDFVEQVVYPCLTWGDTPECFIINEYEDLLLHQGTKFSDYFYKVEYGEEDWRFMKALKHLECAYRMKPIYYSSMEDTV